MTLLQTLTTFSKEINFCLDSFFKLRQHKLDAIYYIDYTEFRFKTFFSDRASITDIDNFFLEKNPTPLGIRQY